MIEIEVLPDGKKVALVKRENGQIVKQLRFDPLSSNGQTSSARAMGVEVSDLLNWVDEMRKGSGGAKFALGKSSTDPSDFVVREFNQTNSQGVSYRESAAAFVTKILPAVSVELLATWTGLDSLCCLDVDYHEFSPPDKVLLESIVYTRLSPKPFAWHFSRGSGLHLFYIGGSGYTAEELASVAALRFKMIDPTAGVELKSVVRGPGGERLVLSGEQDTTGTLLDWLREPDQKTEGLDEWLDEEGFEIGKRYPHEKCPVAPSPDGGKHRDPVNIREGGVHCYVCEGAGKLFGSRRPGFFPWAALMGHPTSGDLGHMVRNLCHWGHAKWVLKERYGVSGRLAELSYRAALKSWHQGKETEGLVFGCFSKDIDKYARVGSGWVCIDDVAPFSRNIMGAIQSFPTTQYVDNKGAIKSKPARVVNMLEAIDLTEMGYPPIQLIFGAKMASEFLGQVGRTVVAVTNPALRKMGDRRLPRYVPFSKRMKLDKAREILEQIYPGMDWSLIYCILCGIGSAQETELGLPPRLFVTGPSSAAKTSHFKIASAIAGVKSGEPSVQGSDERLRQAIMSSIQTGPVVVINEIFKDAYRSHRKQKPAQALEPVLNLEKDSLTHVLYRGPEKLGKQFVLGFTEIALPLDIKEETQIARRIRYHRLDRSKRNWPLTIAAAGITDMHLTRLVSLEVAEACNAILSDVIDRFFVRAMTFQEQSEELGIKTIEDSEDFIDPTPHLRQFYKLVCSAPEIENKHLIKQFPGYKQITRGADNADEDEQELLSLYTMFSDGGADWTTAHRLMEKDWGTVLGVDDPVKLVMGDDGVSVFVKFQVGPLKTPSKVNQQIVDPKEWVTT